MVRGISVVIEKWVRKEGKVGKDTKSKNDDIEKDDGKEKVIIRKILIARNVKETI